jgi:hypothetical protein
MGLRQSAPFEDLFEWATERAFADTHHSTDLRHLTPGEKAQIDFSISRWLETNRRIETKLLELGFNEPRVLDALDW